MRLGSRAMDLLIALVEGGDELVSKEYLLKRVWPDTFIEEANLRVHVAALRKLLGDEGKGDAYINTVAGRGYRFVAPVVRSQNAGGTPVETAPASERLRPLPAALTRVIGRADSVGAISVQLKRRRFVTIVGPGGIGKTTVALAVAGELQNDYEHGVCFVELAALSDDRLIPGALASALGLASLGDQPLSSLTTHLRDKSMLLILDNCEQALDAVACLAETLLRGAPRLHIVSTSRQPLRGEGEFLHHLSTLEVPAADADIGVTETFGFSAVELFVERAAASLDTFELNSANVGTVAEICRRLDGIPLAIELAAARVDLFGIDGLAARLNDCFALLTKGRRTALPRHQTLRATLDWSFNLLSGPEQIALIRLSGLAGDFSMDAAVALACGPDRTAPGIDAITGLVEKSLVVADLSGHLVQYRLLGTTRIYALEKLALSGESDAIAKCHAAYFLSFARQCEIDWDLMPPMQWLAIYGRSIDDMRSAIDWALSEDGDFSIGLDLVIATAPLWFQLSLMEEYRERLERALAHLGRKVEADLPRQARLYVALGHAVWYALNDTDRMQVAFSRAFAISETARDRPVQLQALWGLWAVERCRGAYEAALSIAERYKQIATDLGDPKFITLANRILSTNHHYLGHHSTARELAEGVEKQAPKAVRSVNNDFQLDRHVAMTSVLARIKWLSGFPDQAAIVAREAVDSALETKHALSIGYALCMAGCPVALWNGDLSEAEVCTGLLRRHAARNGLYSSWGECYEHVIRLRQGSEADVLSAAYIEARVDVSTISHFSMFLDGTSPLAIPGDEVSLQPPWSRSEMLRIAAEQILSQEAPDAEKLADGFLVQAIDVAHSQAALSFELRIAITWARLWQRTGRREAARSLLAATLGKFTEGFATRDLLVAKQLVDVLR